MESSDGSSEHTIHRHMMNLKTADDEDPHLISIPPDVQKLILSYLDSEVLLQMRAANIYYRDKISNDCQDIWNSQIAIIWTYGKGMLNENNMEFIKWSQENNFNVIVLDDNVSMCHNHNVSMGTMTHPPSSSPFESERLPPSSSFLRLERMYMQFNTNTLAVQQPDCESRTSIAVPRVNNRGRGHQSNRDAAIFATNAW